MNFNFVHFSVASDIHLTEKCAEEVYAPNVVDREVEINGDFDWRQGDGGRSVRVVGGLGEVDVDPVDVIGR